MLLLGWGHGLKCDNDSSVLENDDQKLQVVGVDVGWVLGRKLCASGNMLGPNDVKPELEVLVVGTSSNVASVPSGLCGRGSRDN